MDEQVIDLGDLVAFLLTVAFVSLAVALVVYLASRRKKVPYAELVSHPDEVWREGKFFILREGMQWLVCEDDTSAECGYRVHDEFALSVLAVYEMCKLARGE